MEFILDAFPGFDGGNDEAESADSTKKNLAPRLRPHLSLPDLACDLVFAGALADVGPLTRKGSRWN